jgi:hypothetical protein
MPSNPILHFHITRNTRSKYVILLEAYHQDDLRQSELLINILDQIDQQSIDISTPNALNKFHNLLKRYEIDFLNETQAKDLLENFGRVSNKSQMINKFKRILKTTKNMFIEFLRKNDCYISFITPNSKDSWLTFSVHPLDILKIRSINISDRPLISMRIFLNKPVASFYGICKFACQMFKPLIGMDKTSLSIPLFSLTAKVLLQRGFTVQHNAPVPAMKAILQKNQIEMTQTTESKDPVYPGITSSVINLSTLAKIAPNQPDTKEEKSLLSTTFCI